MAGAGIGMMDPAYFVGRRAILDWLNNTFHMNLAKIEETASGICAGAVACQILDAIYPGEVSMSKVRWDCKSSHEFIDNYKVIQQIFEKKGIEKHIEVEKLMRAKYQDNLENMQWFKSFFEKNYGGQPYDAVARRAKGKGADSTTIYALTEAKRGPAHADEGDAAPSRTARTVPQKAAPSTAAGSAAPAAQQQHKTAGSKPSGIQASRQAAPSPGLAGAAGGGRIDGLQRDLDNVRLERDDLKESVASLEKERDFYFNKLRDIEVLLQTYTGSDRPTVDAIFKILYATDEDFVAVDGAAPEQQQAEQ